MDREVLLNVVFQLSVHGEIKDLLCVFEVYERPHVDGSRIIRSVSYLERGIRVLRKDKLLEVLQGSLNGAISVLMWLWFHRSLPPSPIAATNELVLLMARAA